MDGLTEPSRTNVADLARGSADRVADTGVQSWVICARPIERLEAVGLTGPIYCRRDGHRRAADFGGGCGARASDDRPPAGAGGSAFGVHRRTGGQVGTVRINSA